MQDETAGSTGTHENERTSAPRAADEVPVAPDAIGRALRNAYAETASEPLPESFAELLDRLR